MIYTLEDQMLVVPKAEVERLERLEAAARAVCEAQAEGFLGRIDDRTRLVASLRAELSTLPHKHPVGPNSKPR